VISNPDSRMARELVDLAQLVVGGEAPGTRAAAATEKSKGLFGGLKLSLR